MSELSKTLTNKTKSLNSLDKYKIYYEYDKLVKDLKYRKN